MATILVVEDEKDLLRLFEIVLAKEGHTVEMAATFTEFEEVLDRVTPDLAIVDYRFPSTSEGVPMPLGRQAHERLKEVGVATLGMSGDAYPEDFGEGLAGFLRKPFPLDEFRTAVRKALGE